ncbi:MAG TPA: VOC family protein [Burkholderiales bacterium]|nr:VOC family protein [Burkholderiales bacterium]
MPITELNHYFVRANDLEKTKEFYINVLGFEVMDRPKFPFPGYWLGTNGKIQVHMGPHGIENAELYYIGTPPNAARDQSGIIDHIAFLATDPEGFKTRLERYHVTYRPRYLADAKLFQLFIREPNGLTIELNFFGIESDPGWGGEDYAKMPRVQ